ncbi:interleukin-12 subunit beta [Cololabis saira]|uniref:interleukin-12 subunit beta n=1 Tax=Cololabis saira TaxID=129043 RepID=UPI002AD335E6|nr:interleukin-12 subunit beta [Cololabis saira]
MGSKMHPFLFTLLWASACFASSPSDQANFNALMDNVVVLRVSKAHGTTVEVPLTCGDTYENTAIFWKKNGVELQPPLQGNSVKVLVKETQGGNYTCHLGPSGEYVNHTMILVQPFPNNRTVILREESPEDGHIHCSAPNYKGSFHCGWTRTQDRSQASVVLVRAERHMENIPCVLLPNGLGVHCQDSNCSYQEEQHRISLTVYIRSYFLLEAYTKSFYLREIVKPAELPNLKVSEGRVFSWKYPESWDMPCTFFGLHFQVNIVRSGHSCDSEELITTNTINDTKYEVNVKAKKYVFCVRAQDKHTAGPWSHWSQCIVNKDVVSC